MDFEASAIRALHAAHYAYDASRSRAAIADIVRNYPLYDGHAGEVLTKERLAAARPSDLVRRGTVIAGNPGLRRIASSNGTASVWVTPEDGVFTPATNAVIMGIPDEVLSRVALLTSPQCSGASCAIETDGTYVMLPPTADIFAEPQTYIDDVVRRLHDLGPVMLLTNPVLLHALVRRSGGKLELSGAIMSSYQRLATPQRRALARWPLFEQYGATELAGAMVTNTCKHGTPHVWESQVDVEIAHDGSILLTTLEGGGTRLVRYDVGDLGQLRQVTCACGLPEGRALDVFGRRSAAWRQDGAWITEAELDKRLANVSGLDFVQITRTRDALRVALVPGDGATVRVKDVCDALRMDADVVITDRIAANAGKYPFVRRWDA